MTATSLPLLPAARWRQAVKIAGLPPEVTVVAARLCDFGPDDAAEILMPSIAEVAEAAQVTHTQVLRALTALVVTGWVARARDRDDRPLVLLTCPTGVAQ